jgi:hypothetical protein
MDASLAGGKNALQPRSAQRMYSSRRVSDVEPDANQLTSPLGVQ